MFICPKCGREQPKTNNECIQCGVIFNKIREKVSQPEKETVEEVIQPEPQLLKPDVPVPPLPINTQEGETHTRHKYPGEILILRIIAWANLILGTWGGFIFIRNYKSDISLTIGIAIIFETILLSTFLFIVCVITQKISTMSNDISSLKSISQKLIETV